MAQFSIYGLSRPDVLKILLGVVVTAVYTVIRSRRSRLRWQVNHQSLGSSTNAPAIGQIAITHNGKPITNLVLSTVTVENDYWRDFRNISVCVKIQEGHQVLIEEAQRTGELKNLEWSQRYSTSFDNLLRTAAAGQKISDEGALVRREYAVPVLNRGESITMRFLVDAVPPLPAYCQVSVEAEAAIAVYERPAEIRMARAEVLRAFFIGLLLTYPLVQLVMQFAPENTHVFLLVAVGASITGVGAAILHGFRWLKRHAF